MRKNKPPVHHTTQCRGRAFLAEETVKKDPVAGRGPTSANNRKESERKGRWHTKGSEMVKDQIRRPVRNYVPCFYSILSSLKTIISKELRIIKGGLTYKHLDFNSYISCWVWSLIFKINV